MTSFCIECNIGPKWIKFLELQVVYFYKQFLRKNTNGKHLKIKFT